MRVLFVAPYLPSPARFRSLRLIQGLASLGHRVTVVALCDEVRGEYESRQALASVAEAVHVIPLTQGSSFVQSALHFGTNTPIWAASHMSPAMSSALSRLLSEYSFDIGHIEHLRAAYVAPILKRHMPVIFDAVDTATDEHQMRLEDTGSAGLGRLLSQSDYKKLQRFEPHAAAQFDKVLISSDQGAGRLAELAEAEGLSLSVNVLPNGVDLDYFRPQYGTPILPGNIVFSGQFGNFADRDGVQYFCDEVFPGIRNAYPLATVTFVGGDPTPTLQALSEDRRSGIEVTGRVVDARPYLARAAVAICPLRATSSSRNRVLQLMAMGKALVAAPAAVRGVDSSASGEAFCLADTPLSFATQIIHLFNHPEEAWRLGQNARSYVEEHHDWSRIVRRLKQVYDEVIAARTMVAA